MVRIAFVLSMVLGLAAVAAAQPAAARGASANSKPAPKIAVVPSAAVNVDPTRVDALTQDLADALDEALLVDAVGGLQVRRELRADLPAACASQPACVQEVGRATGASQLLFVVMVDASGGAINLDVMWVDVATGTSVGRPPISLTSTSDSDAKAKFIDAAQSLLPNAAVRPKPVVQTTVGINGRVVDGTPRHITTPAIITASVAVLGAAAWAGFGLDARSKYDSCQNRVAANQACTANERSGIKHLDYAADAGWAVALAAAIATGVLYGTSGESAHLIAAPADSGTGVSVFAIGRF